jgi:hypothetical protein
MTEFPMKAFVTPMKGGGYQVGAVGVGDHAEYRGPVAEVYAERGWLYVVTDPHEGHAMLNIAALPKLISALRRLQKEISGSEGVSSYVDKARGRKK